MTIRSATKTTLMALAAVALFGVEAEAQRTFEVQRIRATFRSEAPLETINGLTNEGSGSIRVDPSNLSSASGTITIPVRTLRTGIELRDGRPAERHIHNHADLVGALLHRQGLAKRVGEGRVLGRDGREDQVPSQGCDGRLFTANGVRAHVVHGAGHLLPNDAEDVLEA